VAVTHLTRKPGTAFSIERVYADVRAALPDDCVATVWACRHRSSGITGRVLDILAAARSPATLNSNVNHVIGDVHYLTFLLDRHRTVLTIHDMVSLRRRKGVRRYLLWLLWYWLPIRRATAIVVVSESTRAELLEAVRCDPALIHVIHNPVSPAFKPVPQTFNEACPRILQVGTNPNKNLERVAQALSGIPCRLVVVGPLEGEQIRQLRQHGIDYENHVALSDEAIADQYRLADLVVFASTYEGFGLPIVEANAVGRPVVTSRACSMPEVAGDAACLVEPYSVESIRSGLLKVVHDAPYRAALIAAGFRNAERFRVDQVSESYAELYRKVAAAASRNG
jgi:glycosyltransferase involved in cell wall biosynthesis